MIPFGGGQLNYLGKIKDFFCILVSFLDGVQKYSGNSPMHTLINFEMKFMCFSGFYLSQPAQLDAFIFSFFSFQQRINRINNKINNNHKHNYKTIQCSSKMEIIQEK